MAFSVRLTGLGGLAFSAAARTLMSPRPPPDTLPALVVTLTLLPAFSAAARVLVSRRAWPLEVLVLKSGPPTMPRSLVPLVIRMSSGSSSQLPARPRGALVCTACGRASSQPPEVSMKPPSPPSGPPRALKLPYTRVARSPHSTTRPPSPAAVASAAMRAPGAMNTASALR